MGLFTTRKVFRIAWLCCFCFLIPSTESVKRCVECRSRGPLGDCGDPLHVNASSSSSGVTIVTCISGWCGKIRDGTDEATQATQRLCLPSPPSDNEERCGETNFNNKMVFMCFCEGDLCNGSSSLLFSKALLNSLILTVFVGIVTYFFNNP